MNEPFFNLLGLMHDALDFVFVCFIFNIQYCFINCFLKPNCVYFI